MSATLNARFGTPYKSDGSLNPKWEAENIIRLEVPFTLRLAWDTTQRTNTIRVHKKVSKAFQQAFENIWNQARIEVKKQYGFNWQDLGFKTQTEATKFYDEKTAAYIRLNGFDLYGGAYNFRKMRNSSSLSYHSYGIAIDIDPAHHVMGDLKATFPDWYIKCWKDAGFVWGGDWKGKNRDSMHFERTTPSS